MPFFDPDDLGTAYAGPLVLGPPIDPEALQANTSLLNVLSPQQRFHVLDLAATHLLDLPRPDYMLPKKED